MIFAKFQVFSSLSKAKENSHLKTNYKELNCFLLRVAFQLFISLLKTVKKTFPAAAAAILKELRKLLEHTGQRFE